MRRTLILAATLLATPALAQQDPLTILSWGGDFAAMQERAMARPFSEQTGIPVRFVDTDDPAGMVKTQVETPQPALELGSCYRREEPKAAFGRRHTQKNSLLK